MTELKLSAEDATVLRDVLTGYLSELRGEISATDIHDFKENLKHRAQALTRVLDQLPLATESEAQDSEERSLGRPQRQSWSPRQDRSW